MRTHSEVDARSLALHRLVAEKIRNNPDLMQHARATLTRWQTQVDGASQPYLKQWDTLINQGIDVCLKTCIEESQLATALRQSSPFCGVLTHKERFEFLKNWRLQHETSGT